MLENKEKEGEFYKKFLQRFNNKVPVDNTRNENFSSNRGRPCNYDILI